MLIKDWTNSRPQWLRNASQRLRNESIRRVCFTVVTIGQAGPGNARRGDWESHLSHAPGSQNPYTIGGFSVLDVKCHVRSFWTPQILGYSATVARGSLKTPRHPRHVCP